jgi:hypothetical protein
MQNSEVSKTRIKNQIKKDIKQYKKFISCYGYTKNLFSLIWYFNLNKRIKPLKQNNLKTYIVNILNYGIEINDLKDLFIKV